MQELCTTEMWTSVVGFEGLYEVSNLGRVKSLDKVIQRKDGKSRFAAARVLKFNYAHGYRYVDLAHGGVRVHWTVHRIVLEAFVGKRGEGQECRHLNGDRTDNRLSNLVWGTYQEQAADKVAHGTSNRGERSAAAKLTEADVREVRRLRASGVIQREVARLLGVTRSCIAGIDQGHSWATVPP